MQPNKINLIECNDANTFGEYLSPQQPLKKYHFTRTLFYRGQGDANWPLIPKIFRNDNIISKQIFRRNDISFDDQVAAELMILNKFKSQCDLSGLRIHNDSLEFREENLNFNKQDKFLINPSKWPNDKLRELMALAQHHGVPTRLLDWSLRSYVAAYFAASSALANSKNWKDDSKIAVWILDKERIKQKTIRIITVPGSTSCNLAAQQGVFTLVNHKNEHRGEPFQIKALEDEIGIADALYKITLPAKESGNILALCKMYGVSASTLFPGFDGAATAVNDWIKSLQLSAR